MKHGFNKNCKPHHLFFSRFSKKGEHSRQHLSKETSNLYFVVITTI